MPLVTGNIITLSWTRTKGAIFRNLITNQVICKNCKLLDYKITTSDTRYIQL